MTDQAQYRFLPWARRGLAAAIAAPDAGAALPARATISVGVTLTNVGTNGVNLGLYGPGDVLGIDPRLIVRVSPRAGSTNVETNYLAGIEFDPPDFPWMFTPASADGQDRLRPWLVLIVLDRARVDLPKADRLKPLPTVSISAEAVAQELPDLSEAWAWAHTQVLVEQATSAAQLPDELRQSPELNISRLVCPRRLEANHQYVACLVPAFDAGVTRGLGGAPDPGAQLGPAWASPPGAVELPVYFHWEFATGPLGDFESLARKLKPFACPDSVGITSMYIGDGNPVIAPITPEDPQGTTQMDGALRAPQRSSGALSDIAQALQDGLQTALNAPTTILSGGPPDATPVLGPPIYGQWHARTHEIAPEAPAWLRELNLDPRARVAAGLGAEVVRKWQEDFMQAAWEQVGAILKAGDLLNWGRLSMEANLRLFARHFQSLPPDRLLSITAPLHTRTLFSGVTLLAKIGASSLPNAAADPALRRLTSPQRPLLKATVRRLERDARLAPSFAAAGRSTLIAGLASGAHAVEPTRFLPDGLVGSVTLDTAHAAGAALDLTAHGLPISLTANQVAAYASAANPLSGRDFQASPISVTPRSDLSTAGVITRTSIDNITAISVASSDPITSGSDLQGTIRGVLSTAVQNPAAKGLLISLDPSHAKLIDPIEIGQGGAIFVHGASDVLTQIGTLGPEVLAHGITNVNRVLSELPVGTLSRTGALQPSVGLSASGEIVLQGSAFGAQHLTSGALVSPGSLHKVIPLGTSAILGGAPILSMPTVLKPIQPVAPIVPPTQPVTPVLKPPLPIGPVILPTQPPPPVLSNTVPMPLTAAVVVKSYDQTMRATLQAHGLNTPTDAGRFVGFDMASAGQTLLARIDPAVMVPKRMLELVKVEGRPITAVTDLGLFVSPLLDRIMAAPDLPAPTYSYLASYDKERFVPGIGVVPLNSITLLETNTRFIEAFLVGLNYEMNRELLWRAYPTDQRGTPFCHFWQWLDGQPDIPPIHTWPGNSVLASHARGAGAGGQIVMMVRGDLIRRYPNAVLLAWKAKPDQSAITGNPADIKGPVFQGRLDPDVIFAGFDLVDADLAKDGGWFFLVQEQPTEPRFGFDQPQGQGQPGPLGSWADASWAHTGVPDGGYLRLAGNPLSGRKIGGLIFGKNAAHLASITLQQPMRVAVHSRFLVK